MDRLLITVKEIKGNCPVYKIGDRIVLDEGYRLNLKETNNLCMHSLSSIKRVVSEFQEERLRKPLPGVSGKDSITFFG